MRRCWKKQEAGMTGKAGRGRTDPADGKALEKQEGRRLTRQPGSFMKSLRLMR